MVNVVLIAVAMGAGLEKSRRGFRWDDEHYALLLSSAEIKKIKQEY